MAKRHHTTKLSVSSNLRKQRNRRSAIRSREGASKGKEAMNMPVNLQAPKAPLSAKPSFIPPKYNPEDCDPIYGRLRDLKKGYEVLAAALDIPEIPLLETQRNVAEDAAHKLIQKAYHRLASTKPKTVAGAIAALGFFAYGEPEWAFNS